jgi:chemotaxis protein CheX
MWLTDISPIDYSLSDMPRRRSSPNDEAVLPLEASLDLVAAMRLREQTSEAIARSTSVVIDASAVERITTPCVQVLVAAARTAAAEGRTFTVGGASGAFEAAFLDLGLGELYQTWSAAK